MKLNKIKSKASKKIGKPPGALVDTYEGEKSKVVTTVFDFDEEQYSENRISDYEGLKSIAEKPTVTWINVNSIQNINVIKMLGEQFKIDSLILEDILDNEHRPKVEEYENYCFVILKMYSYNNSENKVESEQVSILFRKGLVLSFQEKEGDVFDPIRDRIRKTLGRVRKKSSDYLAYLLIDIVIDNYFYIVEILADKLEKLEDQVFDNPKEDLLNEIQQFKKELLAMKKAIFPLKEMLRFLSSTQSTFVEKENQKYVRDAYDHSISVSDTIESYLEITNSIRDLYMSNMSNKMNQIMKVLTIMASLFIPLTFIVGIYGMNFKNMPELEYDYGYFIVWGVMILVTIGMIIFFKRKGWI